MNDNTHFASKLAELIHTWNEHKGILHGICDTQNKCGKSKDTYCSSCTNERECHIVKSRNHANYIAERDAISIAFHIEFHLIQILSALNVKYKDIAVLVDDMARERIQTQGYIDGYFRQFLVKIECPKEY